MRKLILVFVIAALMFALVVISFRDLHLSPKYLLGNDEAESLTKNEDYSNGKDSEWGVGSVGLEGCYVCDVTMLRGCDLSW